MARGLLSPRHSSSLVCLSAHSFLPAASPSPSSYSSSCVLLAPGACAAAVAVRFFRRASVCIRVPQHGGAGVGAGLRSHGVGRSLLGLRDLSSRRGADAAAFGVAKMNRDPVVCSASSSAAEASSSENVQAPPKVRVSLDLDCNVFARV